MPDVVVPALARGSVGSTLSHDVDIVACQQLGLLIVVHVAGSMPVSGTISEKLPLPIIALASHRRWRCLGSYSS